MKKVYEVEGMTCSGCERAIQKMVGNLKGVNEAKADLQSASLTIDYDPNGISIDDIKASLSRIGYRISGERPAHGQRESSGEAIP